MADIRLKESRIEEERDQRFAVFGLSARPTPDWIVSFEECLSKHTRVAVVVFGRSVRLELQEPEGQEFARLGSLVTRCLEEANIASR